MKFASAKRFSLILAGGIICVGALTCGSPNSPTTKVTLADLQITTQVPNWTADSVDKFDSSTIENYVDGGSASYLKNTFDSGFQELSYKVLRALDTVHLKMIVIDYGTASNAQAEFAYKESGVSWKNPTAVFPYSASEAIFANNSDGGTCFAHFNNFYVELQFTLFDSSSEATGDASSYMTYIHSQIAK